MQCIIFITKIINKYTKLIHVIFLHPFSIILIFVQVGYLQYVNIPWIDLTQIRKAL